MRADEIRRSYRPCSACGDPAHAEAACPQPPEIPGVPEEVVAELRAEVHGLELLRQLGERMRRAGTAANGPVDYRAAAERERREILTAATGGMICYHPRENVRYAHGVVHVSCPDCPAQASAAYTRPALNPWVLDVPQQGQPFPADPGASEWIRPCVFCSSPMHAGVGHRQSVEASEPVPERPAPPVVPTDSTPEQRIHAAAERARMGVW